MIQLTPQMRILVALEPADFRRGIDGLASVCKQTPSGGSVQRLCVRLPQPSGDGVEGAGV